MTTCENFQAERTLPVIEPILPFMKLFWRDLCLTGSLRNKKGVSTCMTCCLRQVLPAICYRQLFWNSKYFVLAASCNANLYLLNTFWLNSSQWCPASSDITHSSWISSAGKWGKWLSATTILANWLEHLRYHHSCFQRQPIWLDFESLSKYQTKRNRCLWHK